MIRLLYVSTHRSERGRIAGRIALQATMFWLLPERKTTTVPHQRWPQR
jgi:hypothetical protein